MEAKLNSPIEIVTLWMHSKPWNMESLTASLRKIFKDQILPNLTTRRQTYDKDFIQKV